MDNLQGSEDELRHSNAPSKADNEAMHCIDDKAEQELKRIFNQRGYDRPAIEYPLRLFIDILDWHISTLHQHSQSLTKSLLAEVEERGPTLGVVISKEYNDGYADACMRWREVLQGMRNEQRCLCGSTDGHHTVFCSKNKPQMDNK